MDKRAYSLVASLCKVPLMDNRKKMKVNTSPMKMNENNLNVLNSQDLHNELDGLNFDDDDDDEFFNLVRSSSMMLAAC